jgi:hypothetical protein
MLRHSAVGINIASTISLELCMFDKPVINLGYNPPHVDKDDVDFSRYYEFDHYRPLVETGAVALAKSESELRVMLRKALTEPQMGSKQRQALIKDMFGHTLDGYSGLRVADRLIQLARNGAATVSFD